MTSNDQVYNNFRIPVPAEFQEIFSHFYFAENNTRQPLTKTLLPSYQTILVFNLGPKVSLTTKQNAKIEIDKCLVLGPIKFPFDYAQAQELFGHNGLVDMVILIGLYLSVCSIMNAFEVSVPGEIHSYIEVKPSS